MATASQQVRDIELRTYALARAVNASEPQLERIDQAMEVLFAILDLDVEVDA